MSKEKIHSRLKFMAFRGKVLGKYSESPEPISLTEVQFGKDKPTKTENCVSE